MKQPLLKVVSIINKYDIILLIIELLCKKEITRSENYEIGNILLFLWNRRFILIQLFFIETINI